MKLAKNERLGEMTDQKSFSLPSCCCTMPNKASSVPLRATAMSKWRSVRRRVNAIQIEQTVSNAEP